MESAMMTKSTARANRGKREMTKPFSVAVANNFRFINAFLRMWAFVAVVSVMCVSAFAADTSVVAPGAKVEKLAEGFSFTDGPSADVHGNVFFTDNLNNRIVKWNAEDATTSDWLKPAGRAVGTYFDKVGNLIVAASEKGELWSIAPDKTISVVVTGFNGKAFYGPNDLWIRPDGGIYFTDPELYASRDPSKRVDIQGVYFVAPDRKTVKRVETDFLKPGGIIGTPDGKTLYIADFIADETYAYDITSGGELTNKRLFCKLNARGMTIDSEGNLYLVRFGVTVFDKFGRKLEHIDIPQRVTNVTFGGKENDLLIVAAAGTVYRIKMRVKGAR
jgi:gluconolactonase